MARKTQVLTRRIMRRPVVRRALLLLLIYVSLSLLLLFSLLPESVQLEVGQASPRYIGAPRTVEDRFTTQRLREQAKQAVPDIYQQDPAVLEDGTKQVQEIFNLFISIGGQDDSTKTQKLEQLRQTLPIDLPDTLLEVGLSLSPETSRQLVSTMTALLQEAYGRGIKTEALLTAEEQLFSDIYQLGFPAQQASLLAGITSRILQPNMLFNASATERARQDAESKVLGVTVQKGQKIIGQGEIATEREIILLEDLGLLKTGINWALVLGSFAFVGMALMPMFFYLMLFKHNVLDSPKTLLLLGLILLLTFAISKVMSIVSGLLMPVAMATILIAVLVDPRLASVSSITVALIAGALGGFEISYMGVGLVGAVVGSFSVSRMHHRFDLVRAGALVATANGVATLGFGLLLGSSVSIMFGEALRALSGGVFSAILGFGLLPFLERPFGIASTVKLLELSNPNQPLLRRLLIEAPGTYNHSIVVANLAEAAAEAVGADGLLARVGSYYHDVGKLRRPYFFIENQFMMDNPHDKYPPSLSTLVITSHVKDGVEIGKEHKLPEVVTDIIQQHHGTTMVNYFYHKAKEQGAVEEADFRYAGPTPQTKEAAIVMLADSVEAAVRSLSQPTPGRIEGLVRKIIKDRLNDGQLDECDITLRELDIAGTAFVHILSGIFHKRIEYPDKLKEGERVTADDTNKQ